MNYPPQKAGATQAPQAAEKLEKLKAVLRGLFQLDRGDLDFGLYRIMKMKSVEVGTFLESTLLPQVKTTLGGVSDEQRGKLEQDIGDAIAQARDLGGIDPEKTDKVKSLRFQLAAAKADATAEADVYNHLANFFERYYSEGDFMPRRRYKGGGDSEYLIPYDGEEVKLHWANADQYYIKTTENYAAYIFTVGDGDGTRRVRFEVVHADNEKDNIKEVNGKQRRFLPAGKDAVAVKDGELVVRFEHRPLKDGEKKIWPGNGNCQQSHINRAAAERILNWKNLDPSWEALLAKPAPTEGDEERTTLAKHLERYTAKNSFDYFIHKDLGGFLRRELDLYLKHDVLNVDDLAAGDAVRLHRALARMRAVRHTGEKIIAFLAQLEDYQKALWLKKKFVLETQYCVTLDRVPESLYEEIASNDAQREEWVNLFAIDEINGSLIASAYSTPLTIEFLKANRHLVLDTRHFGRTFTDTLLAGLSEREGGLDGQLDGLLVHGENFQALNLMQTRYQGAIQSAYIDPPFNTGNDFLFKDRYRFSSWLCFLLDRIDLGRLLLTPSGSHFLHLDHNANYFGRILMDDIFGKENLINEIVWRIGWVSGYKTQADTFVRNHDTLFYYAKNKADNFFSKKSAKIPYTSYDKKLIGEELDSIIKKWKLDKKKITNTKLTMRYASGEVFKTGLPGKEGEYKEGKYNMEDTWNCSEYEELHSNKIKRNAAEYTPNGAAITQKPEELLERIIDLTTKKGDWVLDYFCGAGTSVAVAYKLNRKFLAVELESYFDEDVLWRLKKILYGECVGISKKVPKRTSGFVKYVRLESYEDTLDNLELMPLNEKQKDLLADNPALAEDYQLRYTLGKETAQNAALAGKNFTDPFAYTLSVIRDGARHDEYADLPETFNFLLGLRVQARRRIDGVLAVTGTDAQERLCLILWRNLAEINNATLDTWFTRHRAKFPKALDAIYVNGDCTLRALQQAGATCTVKAIEPEFRELMFGGKSNV